MRFVKGLLSSASAKFQPMIDSIKQSDKTMGGYANTATAQLSKYYQETGLHNQEAMMADLSVIRETLESSREISKIFADQVRQLQAEMKDMKKISPFDKAKELFDTNTKALQPADDAESVLRTNQSRREPNTCNWIFDIEEYKTWRTSAEGSLLWVSGVGGMGKSILMSAVIDTLQQEFWESKEHVVQYFFCSSGDESTRTAARIRDQVLHQLYQYAQSAESPDVLDPANKIVSNFIAQKGATDAKSSGSQQKKSEKSVGFEEAYRSLAQLLSKKVFLVIDALDECSDRRESQILKSFREMLSPSDDRVKIVIGSRPELGDDLRGTPTINIGDHNGPDIEKAAKAQLDSLPGLDVNDRTLACEAIVKKAKGLFRCVDPAIEFLKKPWRRPLENRLAELPDGLDNSYQQAFLKTDPDYLDLLNVGLNWSIFCINDPTIAEVMDAYSRAYSEGVEGNNENPYDAKEDALMGQTRDQIRKAGSNTFLEVTDNRVSVRHPTVKEFFLKSEPSADFANSHCADDLCANCKLKAAADRPLRLSEKEGHLRMAITICK